MQSDTKTGKRSSSTKQGNSPIMEKKLQSIRNTLKVAMNEIKQESRSLCSMSFIKRISLDLNYDKMEKMIERLQKGYVVNKHSPNTSEPHSKFIYISPDHRFFCWKSLDKDDEKLIQLRKVTNMIKDQAQLYFSASTAKEFEKILIIYSSVRTLELEFKSIKEKNNFYEEFSFALKNSKRMHLSYRF